MSRPRLGRARLIQIQKLLWLVLLLAFAYVFVSGLLSSPPGGDDQTAPQGRIDITHLAPGEYRFMEYGGELVLVLHRDAQMLQQLQQADPRLSDPASQHSLQPPPYRTPYRSQVPDYLVVLARDPSSSCQLVVVAGEGQDGGIRDLCSGNRYDWAGRALAPALLNLTVPDYDLGDQSPVNDSSANNPPRP